MRDPRREGGQARPRTTCAARIALFALGLGTSLGLGPAPAPADVGPVPGGTKPMKRRFTPIVAKRHPAFRLKWKTKVGLTHFRHTILHLDRRVVLGTNGSSFGGLNEKDDGVYVLSGQTGKLERLIRPAGQGDRDVNGVSSDGTHIYFGTDEGELFKHTLDGKQVWQVSLDGDLEGTPALADLDGDQVLDVAAACESGTLYAVSGRDGKVLWKQGSEELPDYGAKGYLASPALGDLNGDKAPDVIVGARDGVMRAYSGRNGKLLWSYRTDSGIHASAALLSVNADRTLDVLGATAYSKLFALDGRTGAELWTEELSHPGGGIEGLFSSPVPFRLEGDRWCALIGTAWWASQEGLYCVGPDGVAFRFQLAKGKISSSAIIADWVPGGGPELAFGAENGGLYVLSGKGKEMMRAPTGGPIECTPMTADIDGDNRLELLAASQDGFLYAFDTPSAGPVLVPQFRVNAAATGEHWPLSLTKSLVPPERATDR